MTPVLRFGNVHSSNEARCAADVAAFLFHNAPLLDWIPLNSFWAVSDVFEEGGMRSKEFTNQYGMISINGVPKPSFRAFELLATAGNYTLPAALTDGVNSHTQSAVACDYIIGRL